jgi:hypothetical protein
VSRGSCQVGWHCMSKQSKSPIKRQHCAQISASGFQVKRNRSPSRRSPHASVPWLLRTFRRLSSAAGPRKRLSAPRRATSAQSPRGLGRLQQPQTPEFKTAASPGLLLLHDSHSLQVLASHRQVLGCALLPSLLIPLSSLLHTHTTDAMASPRTCPCIPLHPAPCIVMRHMAHAN